MPWRRELYQGTDFRRAINISDLREVARGRVPNFIFEYIEGGAEDEATVRQNRAALEELHFVPQTLVDTQARHLDTSFFGRSYGAPLLIGPTGGNGMVFPRGDLALSRAATGFGIPFCLSTMSTVRLEQVAAEAGGGLWMQLYVMHNRKVAEEMVKRAFAAGYEALVFTTDANVAGAREWDRRNFRKPGQPTVRNMVDALRHPRWIFEVLLRHGVPRFENFSSFLPPGKDSALGASTVVPKLFGASLSWSDVDWLRRIWPGQLLIKGVLSVADAERAAQAGCDGIVLTNHGGRQLDYCVSPVDVLPEISRAVGHRLLLLVDGGFRRGTDVVKALALGAHGVMLGRATLYGLAAGGEQGVHRALEIMTTEIHRVLGQLGCRSVGELGPHLVRTSRRLEPIQIHEARTNSPSGVL